MAPCWLNPAANPPSLLRAARQETPEATWPPALRAAVAAAQAPPPSQLVAPSPPSSSSSSSSAAASPPAAAADAGLTIAEKLERRYAEAAAEAAAAGRERTDVQRRIERRAAYMEEADARDDTPFFLGVAAAFFLPAAVILGWAQATGYLQEIYTGSLSAASGM